MLAVLARLGPRRAASEGRCASYTRRAQARACGLPARPRLPIMARSIRQRSSRVPRAFSGVAPNASRIGCRTWPSLRLDRPAAQIPTPTRKVHRDRVHAPSGMRRARTPSLRFRCTHREREVQHPPCGVNKHLWIGWTQQAAPRSTSASVGRLTLGEIRGPIDPPTAARSVQQPHADGTSVFARQAWRN